MDLKKIKFTITKKMVVIVMILALSQLLLIGLLAHQTERSLEIEQENRLEVQKQQVEIQATNFESLMSTMHSFTAANIQTNREIALMHFDEVCGDYVEMVEGDGLDHPYLECETGYIIEDKINEEKSLLQEVTNIVGGPSSLFVDLGDGKAKKISTTVEKGMYAYGFVEEGPIYEDVLVDGKSILEFVQDEGVYKSKTCDPLENQEGEIVGKLCVGIPEGPTVEHINEEAEEISFGDEGIIYLLDTYEGRYGQVQVHPEIESGKPLNDKQYIAEILKNEQGTITYERNNRTKIAAYTHFEPYETIVVAENNLIEEQSVQTSQILMLSLGLLIASIVIALLFSRTITRPLIDLKNSADKITSGEFETKIPQRKSKDEIAELTASLEMLIMAFKNKVKAEEKINEEAQQKEQGSNESANVQQQGNSNEETQQKEQGSNESANVQQQEANENKENTDESK